MVLFNPDALYPLSEVEEMLEGVVTLDTFLDRLGLRERRVFKSALWGWEVLEASRKAPAFSELRPVVPRSPIFSGARPKPVDEGGKKAPAGRLSPDDL